ncbi:MAG TPA: SDR family oxidoreductase [Thermoplasmata archaeon]|nr:SDR family oxidoreductase [Thermoplasmata archaeon]
MTADGEAAGHERPTALVTGAGRGLGAALARFLAGAGYDLVLNARTVEHLHAVARSVRACSVGAVEVAGDISDPATRAALVHAVTAAGRLDLLINNASELGRRGLGALATYPAEDLDFVLRVNLLAPLALAQDLLPWLRARRGLIVNISSDAAVMGYPGWGAYAASKAALDSVSRTLASELRGEGVAVVSVDPGDMRTSMHQAAFPGEDISDRPSPEVTLPFWAWLLGRPADELSGHRFRAQSRSWEVPA